jgi:hypothetical protein
VDTVILDYTASADRIAACERDDRERDFVLPGVGPQPAEHDLRRVVWLPPPFLVNPGAHTQKMLRALGKLLQFDMHLGSTLRLTYRRRGRRWSAKKISELSETAERKARAAARCRRLVRPRDHNTGKKTARDVSASTKTMTTSGSTTVPSVCSVLNIKLQ